MFVAVLTVVVLCIASSPSLGSPADVLSDAQDGQLDQCYSRVDLRDALRSAREDQRLYADLVGVIEEGAISNVTVPGQPCGSARRVPRHAIPLPGSGAGPLWFSLLGLVAGVSTAVGLLERRHRSKTQC